MIKKFLQLLTQKGQTLVLYALLVPLLAACGGVVLDLGWYYMNVSRLQSAADSAAIAGAQILNEKNNATLTNKFPDEVSEDITGDVVDKKDDADERAETFLAKNWKDGGLNSQEFLYRDEYDENDLYYIVTLNYNNFKHLFSFFDDWGDNKISVQAVAKLTAEPAEAPEGDPVTEEIQEDLPKLAVENVVNGNWELEAAKERGKWKNPDNPTDNYYVYRTQFSYSAGKEWHHYNTKTNNYVKGDCFRSATIEVSPGKGQLRTTLTNTYNTKPDSINLSYRQDIARAKDNGALKVQEDGSVLKVATPSMTAFDKDWDLRRNDPYNKKTEVMYYNQNGEGGNYKVWDESRDLRIHNIYNFNKAFEVRNDRTEEEKKNNPYDILWARIESESFIPLKNLGITDKNSHVQFKSVRQIIININSDNTIKENGQFKYRPIVFFYDGPEKIDMNSSVRDSKPVILNLNKDFRGILFAPYSPVIFNDNGKKFYGFIVAKEYREFIMDSTIGQEVEHKNSNKMYVNKYGDVRSRAISRTNCGEYYTFGIVSFKDYDYQVEDHSQHNLFLDDRSE